MAIGDYLKEELYNLINRDTSIFEFIQSGSLDGIWYWDLENPEIEWMSPKFWETLGYSAEEKKHMAKEWQSIIFQEDLKTAIKNFEKHCADPNYPYDQIVRYKHKKGFTVWIRCRGMAIRNDAGKAIRMLGAHTDISDLKRAQKEISRLTEEYEKVFNGTQDAMFLIEVLEEGQFRYIRNNLAHQNKTGISLRQIMNKTPRDLLGDALGRTVEEHYKACVIERKSTVYEETLDLPAGLRIWLTTLTPIFEEGEVSHIVGSAADITERKKLEDELKNNAYYDKLTGLPNRRLFFEVLSRMILESARDHSTFALLFIDLDGFKTVNDTFGHDVGDEVLVTAGNRLVSCVRKSDIVARMGGDEFTVIVRDVTRIQDVDFVVKEIHSILGEQMNILSHRCKVNASIGVAFYPEDGQEGDALLKKADSLMYEVKKSGKGGFKYSKAI